MSELLRKLRKKKEELKKAGLMKENPVFSRVEELKNRKVYHTKVFKNIFKFGVNSNSQNKFIIFFVRTCGYDKPYINFYKKASDKFLGLAYGYIKPTMSTCFVQNNAGKKSVISKLYYIRVQFSKGDIFIYLFNMNLLFALGGLETELYHNIKNLLVEFEKQVYEFYDLQFTKRKNFLTWLEQEQQKKIKRTQISKQK